MNEIESKLKSDALNCLGCASPRCEQFCHGHLPHRTILSLIKQDKFIEASELLYSCNPFPELTLSLCDCESGAYGHCIKNKLGSPIDTKGIESLLSTYPLNLKTKPYNGKNVSIIGAGPAGCSLGFHLAKLGYWVTIFDENDFIGGAILSYIPRFRFDEKILNSVFNKLKAVGVKFAFSKRIENDDYLALKKKNDFICLCLGTNSSRKIPFESNLIEYGLSFLKKNCQKEQLSFPKNKVFCVYGGGNVAFDCANLLLNNGYKVNLLYRRDFSSLPANKKEIEHALSKGIGFAFTSVINDIEISNERLLIHTLKTQLGEKINGRASFVNTSIKGDDIVCDNLIVCIGQKPCQFDFLPLDLERKIDEKTYLCGDLLYGSKTIGDAIFDGLQLASIIDNNNGI